MKDVFEIGGKGWIIDEQIRKLDDLPQITGIKWNEVQKYLKTIKNPKKKERFRIICYVTGDFFLSGKPLLSGRRDFIAKCPVSVDGRGAFRFSEKLQNRIR